MLTKVSQKKIFITNARGKNSGYWNEAYDAANTVGSDIFLVGENYAPDSNKWDYVLFPIPKLPKRQTLDFVLKIINITRPDEVWIQKHEGQEYLAIWRD